MSEVLNYIKNSFNLKNQGCYKPAIEMLYKALAIDSDNIEILAQLAHLYQLLGNDQRSGHYIDKVLELDDKHLDCLILLKEIHLAQNELNKAKEIAERIFSIEQKPENLANIVNILNKINDFDAIKEIEKTAAQIDDTVLYEIACAYSNNHESENAINILEKGYEQNPKNEKILLLLGKLLYDKKEFEKSKKIFSELEKINPIAEAMNYLGLFAMEESHFSKAADYFTKAHSQAEQNDEYIYNLASAHFLNGWLEEAQKYFNQAICHAPDNVDYHYSLAYLYYQKALFDKALFELKFINSIDQHHEPSLVLNALIAAKQGHLFEAKKQLEKIIEQENNDDFAYFALCETNLELSQIDAAKKAIEKAIELKPNSLSYLSLLAEILVIQKEWEKAIKTAEKMLEINEKYIFAYVIIAKVNFEQENFEEVFEAAQNIIERDQNSPEGYYYNSLALFEQGDTLFATESLKKALSLDVNNASLYVKMSDFYQSMGDMQNAYLWAKEACEIEDKNYKFKWNCAKIAARIKNSLEAEKLFSQSYRLASFDKELAQDYADFLKSIGKEKQAKALFK